MIKKKNNAWILGVIITIIIINHNYILLAYSTV